MLRGLRHSRIYAGPSFPSLDERLSILMLNAIRFS